MAKIKFNPLIRGMSGKMGGMIFRTSRTGEITVSKSPDLSGVKWSKAQKAHRKRFKEAVAYARAAMADPQIRLIYERMAAEKKNNKRPFDMAVSDYFKGNNLISRN
jgi:hypothetical protein